MERALKLCWHILQSLFVVWFLKTKGQKMNVQPAIGSDILTDADIRAMIAKGQLIKNADEGYIQACSYDLRVGTIFHDGAIIRERPPSGPQVSVPPGAIVSLFTLEELILPADICATAFAMNSMSSEGILVLNPGHIDPGYKGPLTVRAINVRATPKAIALGTAIFTVIFHRLSKPVERTFSRNKPRDKAELEFHETDLEQNPRSLYNLIVSGKDKPLMTRDEVRRVISEHWMSRWTTVSAIIAMICGVVAAVFAFIAVWATLKLAPQSTTTPQGLLHGSQMIMPTTPILQLVPAQIPKDPVGVYANKSSDTCTNGKSVPSQP